MHKLMLAGAGALATRIALTTGFAALAVSPATAQVRVVDQSNVATSNNISVGSAVSDPFGNRPNGRTGQTFTPMLATLNFVTFDIFNNVSTVRNVDGTYSDRPSIDTNLAVYLYAGTGSPNSANLLGISRSVFLAANTQQATLQFDFANPISLVPEQMYSARIFDLTNIADPSIAPGATAALCDSTYARGYSTAAEDYDLCFSEGLSTPSVAAGVPEPATWAMMTLGLGAIGFGMRRRNGSTRIRFA